MVKGKIIVFESGSDGAGKETQSKLLEKKLLEKGQKVKRISFPNYKSQACGPVKMYLNGDFGKNVKEINPYACSLFFAIDRFASFKTEWEDFYNNGGIIILDRYTHSNMIYQTVKMDKANRNEFLDWLNDLEFNLIELPKADLVLFLDVNPKISNNLIKNRKNKIDNSSKKDIHENDEQYLFNTYENSKKIAKKYNWKIISCYKKDNIKPVSEIHDEILNVVEKFLDI